MAEPGWLKTISNHAVISKPELLAWLGVSAADLKLMLRDGFPQPRFGGFRSGPASDRLSRTSRWRVGDVRAWLEGSKRLSKELETEIGAESGPYVKAVRAAGVDAFGRRLRS